MNTRIVKQYLNETTTSKAGHGGAHLRVRSRRSLKAALARNARRAAKTIIAREIGA